MQSLKQQLDEQMNNLKTTYEEKVEDLEKRLEVALGTYLREIILVHY